MEHPRRSNRTERKKIMAQKIVDADMIAAISRGAQSGLTAIQIAAMLGVRDTTVRKHAKKHGIEIAKATSSNSNAIRNEQIKRMGRNEKRRKQSKEKRLKALANKLSKISNPQERKEFTYGQALLAFERKQIALGLRPPPPCGASNKQEKSQTTRNPKSTLRPIVIDGVKFRSRTAAAEALGLGRSVFSSMIHPNASNLRRQRLRDLIDEYKRSQA